MPPAALTSSTHIFADLFESACPTVAAGPVKGRDLADQPRLVGLRPARWHEREQCAVRLALRSRKQMKLLFILFPPEVSCSVDPAWP